MLVQFFTVPVQPTVVDLKAESLGSRAGAGALDPNIAFVIGGDSQIQRIVCG